FLTSHRHFLQSVQHDHLRTLGHVGNPRIPREISQHAQDAQDVQVLFHITSPHSPTNRAYPWSRIALRQNPTPVRRPIYVPCVWRTLVVPRNGAKFMNPSLLGAKHNPTSSYRVAARENKCL